MRTIKLVRLNDRPIGDAGNYKVLTVKNSAEYDPNEILDMNEVEQLCADKRWDVTIVGDTKEET